MNSATPVPLCLPAQGLDDATRIGNKITVCNVNVKLLLQVPGAITAPVSFRVVCYVDKQTNGTTSVYSDYLSNGAVEAFQNVDNAGRYTTLFDELVDMNYFQGALVTGAAQVAKHVTFGKKNLNIPMMFSGATGTIAACKTNQVYLLVMSNTAAMTITGYARVKYYDA